MIALLGLVLVFPLGAQTPAPPRTWTTTEGKTFQSVLPLLILLSDRLGVRLSVRVEEFFPALLPCRLEFGRRDVPVRPAFLRHSTEVQAQFFHRGAAEEPVAVIDLIDDKNWFEDDRVGDHRIVARVGVFGDVEVLLDGPPRVRQKGPVGPHSVAEFVRLGDVVGTDRGQPAIADLELTMQFNKPFVLAAVLGAKTSAAQDQTIGCCPCRSESFRCLPVWSDSS
jgi:hypothetical protein